ncbi:glucose-6-phosphate dehydrogenase [Permianibacter sp. IMCC34836]|uniref:glucose-6-phosphate dehydrogenase n=1 Tax=Permianibacter fluminis TaxID=2738515 RepID=UPI001554D475|nr:glucose-6-phosphate dehydrogenase [Permianibacter fluminis]NQD37495.1 glucose-6-phosphate dehydrogenase [Permianibacter fluminis]
MATDELPPFELVIFGGTGDLAMRKLLPALYQRQRAGTLAAEGRIIASAREQLDRAAFVARVEAQAAPFIPDSERDPAQWQTFLQRLDYVAISAAEPAGYQQLQQKLAAFPDRQRIFYLATAPQWFGVISEQLKAVGLNGANSRVVLEKPLGHDLASSCQINDMVGRCFNENQIFRIDHYLGKETVQNLLVLRFANRLFESLWNTEAIDHIQITAAEQIGVEARAGFYDGAGALRDMVQNHLLQLLCLVAMEPPASLDADAVRDEKLKVLRSLKPLSRDTVAANVVAGQYSAGTINGKALPGYRDEPGVKAGSQTETFVALKAEINNWRWAKVPFYLRTGKRLATRYSEIVVQFREVPHSIFAGQKLEANKLIIRLQPEEDITLQWLGKQPGTGMQVRDVALTLADAGGERVPEAYERLLSEAILGRQTLFMRRDEQEAAWSYVTPILDAWASAAHQPAMYPAGSWGPEAATRLLTRDGRDWHGIS